MAPRALVLLGYYGYGNVGDDALCEALTAGAFAAGVERILIPCGDPARLPADPRITPLGRFDWRALRAALRDGAVLFVGGGGLLQNITSHRSLLYYLAAIALARRARRPYVLGFGSIGPLRGGWARALVRRAAAGAAAVGVRDQRSRDTLVGLGLPADRITVAGDAAFLAPPPTTEAIAAAAADLLPGPRLAVCPRPTAHTATVRAALAAWLPADRWPGSRVYLASAIEDLPLCVELAAAARAQGLAAAALPPAGPALTAARLAACERVAAERLHPLIFATQAGVPALAIDYDPKVAGLATDLDLPLAGTDAALTVAGLDAAWAELDRRGAAEGARLNGLAAGHRASASAELARLLAALAG